MKSKNLSEKILRSIKSRGFKVIELDPVIETKYILQRSGENFKKFLFSFYDLNGKELCLRPDLTVSSVLRFIQNKANKIEKVCYSGEAFRKSSGSKKSVLKIGNVELFNLLINKLLDIPTRWKNRLKRYYWNEKYFNELLKRLETNSDIDPVWVETDKKRFLKMRKEDPKKIIAGRTYKEILDRFNIKINDPRKTSTGKSSSKIIKEFLRIKCPIEKAPKILNSFFKKNSINIVVGKDFFPLRKNNNKKLRIEFSAANGREVEFYSSMIFSIEVKIKSKFKNFIIYPIWEIYQLFFDTPHLFLFLQITIHLNIL